MNVKHMRRKYTDEAARRKSVRPHNRSDILRLLREHGPLTRSALAERTGLTPASVTRIVGELRRCDMVAEIEFDRPIAGSGRRPVLIELRSHRLYCAAVHVGLLYVDVGLFNLDGRLIVERRAERPAGGSPEAVFDRAAAAVGELAEEAHLTAGDLAAIGLGTGGWVDPLSGELLLNSRLGWERVPARELLEARLGVPAAVDSNVNGVILAEARFGIGKRSRNLVLLMVGNVIGAGVLVEGQLYHGVHQQAGQVGHVIIQEDGPVCSCGNRGCLEAIAADSALVGEVAALGLLPEATGAPIERIMELARAEAGPVRDLVRARAALLGRVVALLVNIHDPDLVILAGSAALAPAVQLPLIRDEAMRHVFPPKRATLRIEPTRFGSHAPLAGAAALAIELVYSPLLDIIGTGDGELRPVLRGAPLVAH